QGHRVFPLSDGAAQEDDLVAHLGGEVVEARIGTAHLLDGLRKGDRLRKRDGRRRLHRSPRFGGVRRIGRGGGHGHHGRKERDGRIARFGGRASAAGDRREEGNGRSLAGGGWLTRHRSTFPGPGHQRSAGGRVRGQRQGVGLGGQRDGGQN